MMEYRKVHIEKLNWPRQESVHITNAWAVVEYTIVLIQLTSNISLHCSVLPDNNGASFASPALLTQMSAPPNCDFIVLIIDRMSSSLLTSHFIATSLPPDTLSS